VAVIETAKNRFEYAGGEPDPPADMNPFEVPA
jgi:hypothetical protein